VIMRKRKIQLPNNLKYAVTALLVLFFLLILSKKINFNFLASGLSKLQNGIVKYVYYAGDTFKSIKYVSSARKGINELSERNIVLGLENQSLRTENERLKKMLQIKTENSFKRSTKCYASVIGASEDGFVEYYLIDKGSSSGVLEGDGVVAEAGVLGRVITVMPESSRVQLLTDAKSSISARVDRNRIVGILTGKGLNACELNYVPKEHDVIEGDVLVTSGLGRSFPEGVKIGRVLSVDKKAGGLSMIVKVQPYVDVFNIQEVVIVGR
jgi:rod shape-determining protein MreC